VGTLLGVFSLRALGDLATLNLSSAFRQGFAFSELAGTARIANGVLTTDDFAMAGNVANVWISGSANLRTETQDLEVRIAPSLGGAIGAGLTIVNPLLGAGAFVANRLFRPRLDLVTLDYRVTGSFQAPVVRSGRR
jgi:uncharacterized protein YhdP